MKNQEVCGRCACCFHHYRPDNGSIKHLRNAGLLLPDYTTSRNSVSFFFQRFHNGRLSTDSALPKANINTQPENTLTISSYHPVCTAGRDSFWTTPHCVSLCWHPSVSSHRKFDAQDYKINYSFALRKMTIMESNRFNIINDP